jgi:nicotinamide-nucleotide amidase
MEIEIIAIGNELLSGNITNTNAAFISQELLKEGWRVNRQTVLPDDPERLRAGVEEALNRNRLIITTGGLGPTCDDLSRAVVADLFQSDFHYDESLGNDLISRYGNLPNVIDQATVPSKAQILQNPVGTAPGLIFVEYGVTLIMLPGVPIEMKTLWSLHVMPYIREHFGQVRKYFFRKLNLIGIIEPVADKVLRELSQIYPNVEYGIYPSQGTLSIHLTAQTENQAAADELIAPAFETIKERFSSYLFEATSGKIEEAIHDHFIQNGLTLSIAESCTGGNLSARLTALPGSSQYFLGSVVSYSNQLKSDLLGVPDSLLKEKGAVSEEVVNAMLKGILESTGSDYGIALTGIAGPTGGTLEKPVGTVWCAVGSKSGERQSWLLRIKGNREMIIERSIISALGKLLEQVNKKV